jgi:hypothetical protein
MSVCLLPCAPSGILLSAAGTGTTAELVQVSLLTHLALPMLTPNPEAAELLDAQLLDVLADVFRTADANASAFGTWQTLGRGLFPSAKAREQGGGQGGQGHLAAHAEDRQ